MKNQLKTIAILTIITSATSCEKVSEHNQRDYLTNEKASVELSPAENYKIDVNEEKLYVNRKFTLDSTPESKRKDSSNSDTKEESEEPLKILKPYEEYKY